MEINRKQRDKARNKSTMDYEAVDSSVSPRKVEPVYTDQEQENAPSRSGVMVRTRGNHGQEAIQKARDIINNVKNDTLQRPKSSRLADRDWFERNQKSIERLIKKPLALDKKQLLGSDRKLNTVQKTTKNLEFFSSPDADTDLSQEMDYFDNYRPRVDDNAEEYIPKDLRS